jgi:5-methylcytosine-specific restriction endonuclease McrA
LQYGGTNDIKNLQALCCECHSKKSVTENKLRDKIRDAIGTIIKEDQKNE